MWFDYRVYNYWDRIPLVTRHDQMINYLESKFDNIKVNVDTGAIADAVNDTVKETMDEGFKKTERLIEKKFKMTQADLDDKFKKISKQIEMSKNDIIFHRCPYRHKPQPCHHKEEYDENENNDN